MQKRVDDAVDFCRKQGFTDPQVGVVLGSGLGPLAEKLSVEAQVATSDIPGWPQSTVKGHEGEIVLGNLGGQRVLMLKGRVHGYEGYDLAEVVLPIRVIAELGAKILVNTNSAGGINEEFAAGDIMLLTDHLNLQGQSPLRGPNVESWGPRFPDMSEVYSLRLRGIIAALSARLGIELQSGVYVSTPGPQYETPAEVQMMRRLGGDAVGMSSVPEAITARHMGLEVLGLSAITNLAAGISKTHLNHDEVVEAGRQVGARMAKLLEAFLAELSKDA